jgi:hypothetical protein
MRDQPALFIRRRVVFIDRARDGCLLVRSLDDGDERACP